MTQSPWADPVSATAPYADEPYALLLLSQGGRNDRWSYVARRPSAATRLDPSEAASGFASLRDMLGAKADRRDDGPPFQGGVVGLAAYEFGDRLETLNLERDADWPDLVLAHYPAVLAFDHHRRRVLAIGRGADAADAAGRAAAAHDWLASSGTADAVPRRGVLATRFDLEGAAGDYESAVADVTGRIAAGEIFQANIASTWTGALFAGATPFAVFARLQAQSPAPFCAYWRLPGLALVSHSPERFLSLDAEGRVETRPIKGTAPRAADPREDDRLKHALCASPKDRAENLMIVDLMRNDISRVCAPGSVMVPELFALESFQSVHHLVSTVTGVLTPDRDAADLLNAAFPPGSITGAPKIQAMRVIARHEPPRGPWCGSLFWAGCDGAMDSSVLIRSAAFVETPDGWRFRAGAGAGIVADSDPLGERLETEVKISGLRRALTEPI